MRKPNRSDELKPRLLEYVRGKEFATITQVTRWLETASLELMRAGWSEADALDARRLYLTDAEIMRVLS